MQTVFYADGGAIYDLTHEVDGTVVMAEGWRTRVAYTAEHKIRRTGRVERRHTVVPTGGSRRAVVGRRAVLDLDTGEGVVTLTGVEVTQ